MFLHSPALTPSHQAEFEQVSSDVDVEDSDEEKVEVESLQSCPAEGGQHGPVQKETQKPAKEALLVLIQLPHPEGGQQIADVEAEQCHR